MPKKRKEPTPAPASEPGPMEMVPSLTEDQKTLTTLATETLAAGAQFAEKYKSMIAFIREKEMEPKLITASLLAAGWPTTRTSELKRLALASHEIYSEFANGNIGVKVALEKAREEKPQQRSERKQSAKPYTISLAKIHTKLAHKHPRTKFQHYANGNILLAFMPKAGETITFDCGMGGTFEVKFTPPTTEEISKFQKSQV